MTLIELLVVMVILGILFGLGVFFYPDFSSKQKMTTATDRITGALLMAKQRAKRDGRATGVRFANNEMVFLQQPDTPSVGRVVTASNNNLTINADLVGGGVDPLIQPGDYIELNGGGRLHQVVAAASSPPNTVLTIDTNLATPETFIPPSNKNLSNYRIFARPRVLTGEESIKLPDQVAVTPTVGTADVVFSPAGSVILQTNNQGQVFLVVEDTQVIPGENAATRPKFIVAIRLRTGAIGVYPYNTTGDPYSFTRDGRSSGL
jgi:prepilin-type N-terminal cleavage/methylation domain-containing protein